MAPLKLPIMSPTDPPAIDGVHLFVSPSLKKSENLSADCASMRDWFSNNFFVDVVLTEAFGPDSDRVGYLTHLIPYGHDHSKRHA